QAGLPPDAQPSQAGRSETLKLCPRITNNETQTVPSKLRTQNAKDQEPMAKSQKEKVKRSKGQRSKGKGKR
ncbi:MAG TPA: hypothetical protein PKI35_05515, partial [Bacteroidales bacterium]|nr:hypothetical protein [Bacteroidales bacterium]